MLPAAIRNWGSFSIPGGNLWRSDSLGGRFSRNALWCVAGAVMSQGTNLVATVITARLIGRELFGGYGVVQNTVGMFGVLAGMGLGLTATKHIAEFRLNDLDRVGRLIGFTSAIAIIAAATSAVVLLAVAPTLSAGALNAPGLSSVLRISSGVLFFNALNGAQAGVLAGFENFQAIARISLIRAIFAFPLSVAGALFFGLPGAVSALVVTGAIAWLLNHLAIRTECKRLGVVVSFRNLSSERKVFWHFSVPAVLGGCVASPAMWAATAILTNQPSGYAQMGIFTAANQWRTAVAFLPSLLSQPLLSMLSNLGGLGKLKAFNKLLFANVLLSFGLSCFVAAPVVLCSSWIMRAYGTSFREGKPVLILLVIAAVLSSTATVCGLAIMSRHSVWWTYALNLIWAGSLILSALALVPRFGALGLAEAFLLAYVVNASMTAVLSVALFRGNSGGNT